MSALPATYRVQDGCHNCRHVWTPEQIWPDDDGERHICLCGQQPLAEHDETPGDMLDRLADSATNDVAAWGTCGEWQAAGEAGE